MKTIFSKRFVFALLVLTFSSSPVQAEEFDFSSIAKALGGWLGEESLLHTESEPVQFARYDNLQYIALDRMFTEAPFDGWKVHKIAAYDPMAGMQIALGYGEFQVDGSGRKKTIPVGYIYYFVYRGDSPETGERMVLHAHPYGYIEGYYHRKSLKQWTTMLREVQSYLTVKNIYRFGVLEMGEYGGIRFLSNLSGTYLWENVIMQPDVKSAVYDNTEGFLKLLPMFVDRKIGSKKGVLLYGPPGTGKSLVGQTLMTSMFEGELKGKNTIIITTARHLTSPDRVDLMFHAAADLKPTTVFMEDIDLLGVKNRSAGVYEDVNKENVLNELLNGIDGVVDNDGFLIVGTTNKIDLVDEALLRSERIGMHLYIGLPGFAERKQFFERFAVKKVIWGADVVLEWLVGETERFSGADLVEAIQLAKQAAFLSGSMQDGKLLITKAMWNEAFEKIRANISRPEEFAGSGGITHGNTFDLAPKRDRSLKASIERLEAMGF